MRDFRNYAELNLSLQPGVSLFFGGNAQGKTNLLEAIYYVSALSSLRAEKEKDLARWGTSSFFLKARFAHTFEGDEDSSERTLEISVETSPSLRKRLFLDGKPVARKEVSRLFPAVYFGPDDLYMVKGPSSMRRKFMDSLLSRIDRLYQQDLTRYEDALERRNALLKKYSSDTAWKKTFQSLTELLVSLGTSVTVRRQKFISEFAPFARESYTYISNHTCDLAYSSSIATEGQDAQTISRQFQQGLSSLEEAERARGTTLLGPHRDDIIFTFDDKTFRYYGSQGEQRSLVLALKMAEGKMVEQHFREKPVFLLDDVFSELDAARRSKLLSILDPSYQVLLTSTDFLEVESASFQAYLVKENSVTRVARE